jgi:hypothetical protein
MNLHNLESPSYSRGPEKAGNRIALNVWDAVGCIHAESQTQMGLLVPGARASSVGAKTKSVAKTSTRAGTVTQLTASNILAVLIAKRGLLSSRLRHPDTDFHIMYSK